MKGCGKEFVFKKEVVKLESNEPDEEQFEEQNFTTKCKEPLLCPDCSQNVHNTKEDKK